MIFETKGNNAVIFEDGLLQMRRQGEAEIIRNRSRINLGIYTAKKKEGRYLGAAPFGYKNAKDEHGKPVIVLDEDRAPIIRHIFSAFLQSVPMHVIFEQAKKMGLTHRGNSSISKILICHAYGGLIRVRAYKEYPEEIVEGTHEPLVDRITWLAVQAKLNAKAQGPRILSDHMPLRGTLLCHCGHTISGGPSRGRHGGIFYYYRCPTDIKHNHFSAKKVHLQLEEIWKYLSLPSAAIKSIRTQCESILEKKLANSKKVLQQNRVAMDKVEEQLHSVEAKWIANQLNYESYNRWFSELSTQKRALMAQVEAFAGNRGEVITLLKEQLVKLTDLNQLYRSATILQKQQLVRQGFEQQLYFQEGVFRTPSVLSIFYRNELILREKNLLYIEKKRDFLAKIPSGGGDESSIEHLFSLFTVLQKVILNAKP